MKKCTKCNIEKELTKFNKTKANKGGFHNQCKSCIKGQNKKYYQANKEKIKEQNKEHYKANKEQKKEYYQANKSKIKEYRKEYYKANEEQRKEYRKANKEKIKEYHKEYYKEYYHANKEHYKEYNKEYQKERRKLDPLFKMTGNLRTRTWSVFKNKGYTKNSKTQEMLGVNWEVCKAHIERQFTKGMTWDNYGDWHIDHIIPLSSANTEDRLKKLCHYSNLQPLWAVDNLIKSAKIDGQQNKFRF